MSFNIVVLDGHFANPGDLSWDPLNNYGHVDIYPHSNAEEVISRAENADIVIINKIVLGEPELEGLPNLKLIILSATGMDNVDLDAAKKRNIEVQNVAGYSTNSVAQHVFSLLLALTNRVFDHHQSVTEGKWNASTGFSYTLNIVPEMSGKMFGIYGFGKIGQAVAKIARAMEMKVAIVSEHASDEDYPFYRFVSLEELFQSADVISLHAPLTQHNQEIIDLTLLSGMKENALLINTARGGLINETDLRNTLIKRSDLSAALDVLDKEPPAQDHPLLGLPNCLITPHMAWTSQSARERLLDAVFQHVDHFQLKSAANQ